MWAETCNWQAGEAAKRERLRQHREQQRIKAQKLVADALRRDKDLQREVLTNDHRYQIE